MKKSEKKEWLTVDEIANEQQVSRETIANEIKSGRLKAKHYKRIYRIHRTWYYNWVNDIYDNDDVNYGDEYCRIEALAECFGLTEACLYKWRKQGFLDFIVIDGRNYASKQAVAELTMC